MRVILCLLFSIIASYSTACEKFNPIDQLSAQKLMDILGNADAKPIDQMFAFETLTCADQPVVRRFALEQGLNSKQSLLKSQALAEILFQRESIRVEIMSKSNENQDNKAFLSVTDGNVTLKFFSRNRQANCISLSSGRDCADPDTDYVRIDGLKVRIRMNIHYAVGEFSLQPDGSLRGTVRPWGRGAGLAAKIELL
jgi:hypothetical protein